MPSPCDARIFFLSMGRDDRHGVSRLRKAAIEHAYDACDARAALLGVIVREKEDLHWRMRELFGTCSMSGNDCTWARKESNRFHMLYFATSALCPHRWNHGSLRSYASQA